MHIHLLDLLVQVAHAATPPSALTPPGSCSSVWFPSGSGTPGAGFDCIREYMQMLSQVVIGAAGSLSVIMLMVNGYRYMYGPAIPGGSSDAAKKGIGAALLGLAISLLTYIILDTLVWSVTM